MGDGFLDLAGRMQGEAELQFAGWVVRLEAERETIGGQCLRPALQLEERVAAVIVMGGCFGLQLDGPVQAGEGLYGFTLFEQAGTEVGMVVRDVRSECDDAPEVGEALVLASRIYFNQPDQVDDVGRLGEVLLKPLTLCSFT